MRALDRIDHQILDILQKEGRIAISELAARVKRLEREGIILGYHARLNPKKVDRNLLVFLEIKLSAKSGEVFEQVARNLSALPEVLECHLISGEFDYLVKARLKEMSAYRRLLGNLLKQLPASASSHSYVVMEEIKESLYLELN